MDELADFLRTRREQLRPADVGLREGSRRRTPGLRREEVAALADMSTDYYTRLEQARGPHPSAAIVTALARALRLTDDERDHLFHLAGHLPPARHAGAQHVSPGLQRLLDRLTDSPAFVSNDLVEVIAQNPLAVALFGDATRNRSAKHASVVWSWFTEPSSRKVYPESSWPHHARAHVAGLRATYGRRQGDADVDSLVADLLDASAEFRDLWAAHDVAVRRMDAKIVLHPEVGELDLLCETFTSDTGGQTLVLLSPRPGTRAGEQLDLLRVIGTQEFSAPV